jgi:hypothetical protein
MGYDKNDLTIAIPLIYVYRSITNSVYHVSNANSSPKGNDNRFCGDL